MKRKYTLKNAQEDMADFEKKHSIESFDYKFGRALMTFAKKGKYDLAKRFIDKYFELVNVCGNKEFIRTADLFIYKIGLGMDNLYKNGRMELLPPKNMKKGSTTKTVERYLRDIEINYNTKNYSPEEVYNTINSLSDKLVVRYPNLVSGPKVKWNNNKDTMDFKFKSRGFDVSGSIKIDENKLILNGRVPLEAILYHSQIANKIKGRLEKVLPKLAESK